MKTVDADVRTAIRSKHDVKALPRLTAEWNMNRYYNPTVTNDIGPGWEEVENDVDMFPIESIVAPVRPSKGINKARVNHGSIADNYNSPSSPRYYLAGLEDKYKYWISPYSSDSAGNIGSVAPKVVYNASVLTNKIVVTVENSWASPVTWRIEVSTNGGASWQTASSAPTIGGDGRAILYWTGSNWSSTKPANNTPTTRISGIRVVVTRLGPGRNLDNSGTLFRRRDGAVLASAGIHSYFSLIEISARLERDLTSKIISCTDTFDAGETSQVTPVGTITSNVGQVELWNGDNYFSEGNTSSELYGLLEPNVMLNLEYLYHIGPTVYPVQQFRMYAESWDENDESTVTVELSDSSKFLKETYPMEAKYENQTLAQIVYRLCDSVGFTDYNIVAFQSIADFRIPVFWTDGKQTIWEIFDDLSTATQSLIYFDAWGRLNVKSRENAFNPNRWDWTLRAQKAGAELPDIVSLEKTNEFDSNVIKVMYKKADWAKENNGHPELTTVWTPEDTVTLRSTPLLGSLDKGAGSFLINPNDAAHWPFEGAVQIEGEFIGYDAKLFSYIENGRWVSDWVTSQKDYDIRNEVTPITQRSQNHFVGWLRISERGLWNTEEESHTPEAKGWAVKRYNHGTNNAWGNRACWQFHRGSSIVRMESGGELGSLNAYAIATRGSEADSGWRHFGTRFRFNNNALDHRGGIVFNQYGNGDGYYVELRPTNTIDNKDRDKEDEVVVYVIHGGNKVRIKAASGKQDLVVADTWHDLDVYYHWASHRIAVWLDGKKVLSDIVPGHARHAPCGKFGMFIRGKTSMDFEYIYAVARDVRELPDDASVLNRVQGAYVGESWQKEWVYNTRTKRRWVKRKGKKKKFRKNVKYRKNLQFMDEFGPYVHEVREFDIKFDPAPVRQSRLYMTNDWSVVCPEYRADSFGAYFVLANASRANAVVQGEDSLSFAAAGATVNQQLLVYGRALVIGEQEEVEVRNEKQIRARGEIVAEIDSDWIQSEKAAQAVADWIAEHWANGADELQVEVFGNPLFEVGDVVAVEFPLKNMTAATHKYFVTSIRTQFNEGLSTELTLRRKN